MRIFQITPPINPVPPVGYGGAERVNWVLAETLVRLGHDVTLIAGKGSKFSGRLIEFDNLWGEEIEQKIFYWITQNLHNCDVIHDHTPYRIFLRKGPCDFPYCWTNHGDPFDQFIVWGRRNMIAQSNADALHYKKKFNQSGIPVIPSSFFLDESNLPPLESKSEIKIEGKIWKEYLLFLGMISAHKGAHWAVRIAEATGEKLILAGPVGSKEFFSREIKPKLSNRIKYIGVVEWESEMKTSLLREAKFLLYPSQCRESQGISQHEALILGTPVIVSNQGGLPEMVEDIPYTFICSTMEEMIRVIRSSHYPTKAEKLAMRNQTIKKIHPVKQAHAIIEIYRRVINGATW